MGDVTMTVPVIRAALSQYPNLRITMVSNAFFEPLFTPIDRCDFHPVYLKGQHKGLLGMVKLFSELRKKYKADAIADFHGVLRSFIVKRLFMLTGYKTAGIDKGRADKKALTAKEHKVMKQLPSSFDRYAQVLSEIGFPVMLDQKQVTYSAGTVPERALQFFQNGKKCIGVAPFAQHTEKMYPIEKMKIVVSQLSAAGYQLFLFGGGNHEIDILSKWQLEFPSAHLVAGNYTFLEELAIISHLDTMISMDSANMHLASLFGVRVVSIWGATHPFAGFMGWGQNPANAIQVDLSCRPCSVFGNKPCWRGDFACMQMIKEASIVECVESK